MNEKPEGTPNPLNPNPDAPTEATPAEATPAPAEPAAAPEEKAPEEKPATEAAPAETAPVATAEPVVSSEKPAGKKTGLIVGLIILVLALVGGGVAAALLLGGGNNGGGGTDGVSKAIQKLLSGDYAKKVTTKGTVTVSTSASGIPFSTISANLNIGFDGENTASSGKADVSAELTDGGTVKASLEEVYTNSKLYLKVSNNGGDTATTNCANGETTDNCVPTSTDTAAMINMVINAISSTWIKVPVEEMISSNMTIGSSDETTKCLVDAIQNKTDDGIDLAAIYKENEFVKYTTEGVKITKKNYPVNKLTFDAEKLAGFANAFTKEAQDSAVVKKCLGTISAEEVTADDLADVVETVPPIYVEVDGDYNFSRLYFTYTIEEADIDIKADLEFDYKSSVTATEPSESVDLEDLMSNFGGGSVDYDDDDWDDDDWDW